ncbi:MAG TPA: hypothetical protein PKI60_00735 [Oscillospiraceae bacterium]|nr:hypothetical protein [Oscillospiraceae bacterium]
MNKLKKVLIGTAICVLWSGLVFGGLLLFLLIMGYSVVVSAAIPIILLSLIFIFAERFIIQKNILKFSQLIICTYAIPTLLYVAAGIIGVATLEGWDQLWGLIFFAGAIGNTGSLIIRGLYSLIRNIIKTGGQNENS